MHCIKDMVKGCPHWDQSGTEHMRLYKYIHDMNITVFSLLSFYYVADAGRVRLHSTTGIITEKSGLRLPQAGIWCVQGDGSVELYSQLVADFIFQAIFILSYILNQVLSYSVIRYSKCIYIITYIHICHHVHSIVIVKPRLFSAGV